MGRWARSGLRVIRAGWLIVGVSLCLLLAAESMYRLQGFLRRLGSTPATVRGDTGSLRLSEYLKEDDRLRFEWRPYVYYRRGQHAGPYIMIDSTGIRRTVPSPTGPDAATVFLFGGSTMFGHYDRDEWTIPSVLARNFAQCEGPAVRFVNLGETGRVLTQEVIELFLRVRAGARPDVVVFYDGINDVAAMVENGVPGWPRNEYNRVRDFEFGQAIFQWRTDVGAETRAASHLVRAASARLLLLARLRRLLAGRPSPVGDTSGGSVRALLASYRETARGAAALGRAYGFRVLQVWQPMIHTTRKVLSPSEQVILQRIASDEFRSRLLTLQRAIEAEIESAMAGVAGVDFVNLRSVFDTVTRPVFGDEIGHTYEAANQEIAEALMPHILRLLRDGGIEVRCPALRQSRAPH